MDYSQFLVMYQEIGLLVLILLVFLFDTFSSKGAPRGLSMFTIVLFGLLTLAGFVTPCDKEVASAFGGMYVTSPTMIAIKNVLNIGVLIVLIQAKGWAHTDFMKVRRGEFYELLLITLFGMYLMISARHFLLFIIGLETASLPLAALVAFDKNRYESHEAAVKYILTAVFSSAIFMMGLSFVYALAGTLYFNDIAASIIDGGAMLIVAVAFVIAGMGFKLSLVPFHLWTADVYQGAPTAITSYLSVISKGAAAFAFFVIMVQVFGPFYHQIWEWMLYALIILTITVGNLFALRQKNLKRFLAFSSISQAGYIMLGVIAGSAQGLGSLMFYILVYIQSCSIRSHPVYRKQDRSCRHGFLQQPLFHQSQACLHDDACDVLTRRYPSVCRLLQQVLHLLDCCRFRVGGTLHPRLDCVDQHYHIALLLSACR